MLREQICLAILSLDKRFSDVRPRHPRGGPDGGRDIDATYKGTQPAFGAVGFVNQADDSVEKKNRVIAKFHSDLAAALAAESKPEIFVFFTNISFTIGEKENLTTHSREAGISYCDILDRERLRIALDNPDGFAIRYQYLNLPLSEAEQAAFFARWGDDIQSVISTGFQVINRTINRLIFLQESTRQLSTLNVMLELDRTYTSEEIGHFRAFCELYLPEPKNGIISVLFGSSDKDDRMRSDITDGAKQKTLAGIGNGIGGGQWEQRTPLTKDDGIGDDWYRLGQNSDEIQALYTKTGSSSTIGMKGVKFIQISYNNYSRLGMSLQDLDETSFLIRLNHSLSIKVNRVHVYANEYKIHEIPKEGFTLSNNLRPSRIPVDFSEDELCDPWIFIKPPISTWFMIRFSEQTPNRFFEARETQNSLRRLSRQ